MNKILLALIFIVFTSGFSYPGVRTATVKEQRYISKSLDAGYEHWTNRGVSIPCAKSEIKVIYASSLLGADGIDASARAFRGECTIALRYAFFGDRYYLNLRLSCAVVIHELGHLGGLNHTETGIMMPRVDWEVIPWSCTKRFRNKSLRWR